MTATAIYSVVSIEFPLKREIYSGYCAGPSLELVYTALQSMNLPSIYLQVCYFVRSLRQ